MIQDQPDLLKDILEHPPKRRKKLLPGWMKFFMWIFLVMGAIVPLVLVFGIMNRPTDLALYGLETREIFSLVGIIIVICFIIKGATSLSMLLEKDWAIKLGLIDAIIGIAICVFSMAYPYFNSEYKFVGRFELVLLVPYLIKLIRIKNEWEQQPSQ